MDNTDEVMQGNRENESTESPQQEDKDHQVIKEFVDQLDPDELSFLCTYAESKNKGQESKSDGPETFDDAMKGY